MFSKLFALSTLLGLLAALPAQATGTGTEIEVVAGGPDGLIQYNPSFVTADPGTVIKFIFKQKNHTVTQSTLDTPCSPLAGGFNTGFMPVAENKEPFPTALFTVKDTKPVWFYCQQTGHCQKGMVFAINPGESGKLVEFQENARKTPLTPPSPATTAESSHWTPRSGQYGTRAARAARVEA